MVFLTSRAMNFPDIRKHSWKSEFQMVFHMVRRFPFLGIILCSHQKYRDMVALPQQISRYLKLYVVFTYFMSVSSGWITFPPCKKDEGNVSTVKYIFHLDICTLIMTLLFMSSHDGSSYHSLFIITYFDVTQWYILILHAPELSPPPPPIHYLLRPT